MAQLLPTTTIAGAVAGIVTTSATIRAGIRTILLEGKFLWGSGGTTVKVWVQMRVAGGTWRDVANFAFLTTAGTKFHGLSASIAVAAAVAVSDAALADDTILNGFIGDEIRVKYTTTGTYSGATSIEVRAAFK